MFEIVVLLFGRGEEFRLLGVVWVGVVGVVWDEVFGGLVVGWFGRGCVFFFNIVEGVGVDMIWNLIMMMKILLMIKICVWFGDVEGLDDVVFLVCVK